jgi:hypothetical protein
MYRTLLADLYKNVKNIHLKTIVTIAYLLINEILIISFSWISKTTLWSICIKWKWDHVTLKMDME